MAACSQALWAIVLLLCVSFRSGSAFFGFDSKRHREHSHYSGSLPPLGVRPDCRVLFQDSMDSVPFCGTNAVLRRSALEALPNGGLPYASHPIPSHRIALHRIAAVNSGLCIT